MSTWFLLLCFLLVVAWCVVAFCNAQTPEDHEPRTRGKLDVLTSLHHACGSLGIRSIVPYTFLCSKDLVQQQASLTSDQGLMTRRWVLKPNLGTSCGIGVVSLAQDRAAERQRQWTWLQQTVTKYPAFLTTPPYILQAAVPAQEEARITAWRDSIRDETWQFDELVVHAVKATDVDGGVGNTTRQRYRRPLHAIEKAAWSALLSAAFPRARLLALDLRRASSLAIARQVPRQSHPASSHPQHEHDKHTSKWSAMQAGMLPGQDTLTAWSPLDERLFVLEVNGLMGLHHTWLVPTDEHQKGTGKVLALVKDLWRFFRRRIGYGAGRTIRHPWQALKQTWTAHQEWRAQMRLEKRMKTWFQDMPHAIPTTVDA